MPENYYAAVARLPQPWAGQLGAVPSAQAGAITEIRLRSGCPLAVTWDGAVRFVGRSGELVAQGAGRQLPLLSHSQLQQCFVHLCRYSVFSYENQLRQGFFTLPGGHRVGVASQAAWQGQRLCQPQNITALTLRVARQSPLADRDAWAALLGQRQPRLLVAGAPGSGKTTLLRGLARLLSDAGRRVAVLDERCELFPVDTDGFCFTPPWNCDVLSGYPKALAMRQALRALAPQLFLCDELGDGEADGLLESLNGGVGFVATLHAGTLSEVCARRQVRRLLAAGALQQVVLLHDEGRPGRICQQLDRDALVALAQASGCGDGGA